MTEPTQTHDPNVTDDQVLNFSWWLCMLPFFAAMGFFIWKWLQNRADTSFLMYSIGALIVGLVFTALVAGASSKAEDANTASTTNDTK